MMSGTARADHPHLQGAPAEVREARSAEDVGAVLAFGRKLAPIRDRGALETLAAAELHRLLGGSLVCVTPVDDGPGAADEDGPRLVVGAAEGTRAAPLPGLRLAPGAGVGGQAAASGRLVAVDDYAREVDAAELVELMAGTEGVRGAAAVPLRCDGRILGIVFAGRREHGVPGDRELDLLCETAGDLARMLAAADRAHRRVELARADERRRIASELHDDVAPLLFGIGSAAGRARNALDGPERTATAAELERIAALAGTAGDAVRAEIAGLAEAQAECALPLALAATVDRFREALAVELVDLGGTGGVAPDVARVLAGAVAEALRNVTKHAPGAAVVVTLARDADAVEVAVQDDGPGLPPGFAPRHDPAPADGRRFGLALVAERLVPYDGALRVAENEDGGVTVAVRVPHAAGSAA
jgi:signal transduction histidine kinase